MHAIRYLALCLLVPLLAACEPSAPTPAPPKVEAGKPAVHKKAEKPVAAAPDPAPSVPAPKAPAPPPKVVAEKPKAAPVAAQAGKPAAKHAAKTERQPPRSKLDLTLPPELAEKLAREDAGAGDPLTPVLPPLFSEKAPALNPFQLRGRLITNEPGSGFRDSGDAVEGAELHFEFRQ